MRIDLPERRLDRIDFEIVRALQNDARISNKELAAQVHLAPSSCLERVRRLRASGVLRGFHADVDPKALGVGLQALIAIRLRQTTSEQLRPFRTYMVERPEVIAVYYLAGATDFLVHVAVRDAEHLRDVAVDAITSRPEVSHVETSLIFDHWQSAIVPSWADATARGQ